MVHGESIEINELEDKNTNKYLKSYFNMIKYYFIWISNSFE